MIDRCRFAATSLVLALLLTGDVFAQATVPQIPKPVILPPIQPKPTTVFGDVKFYGGRGALRGAGNRWGTKLDHDDRQVFFSTLFLRLQAEPVALATGMRHDFISRNQPYADAVQVQVLVDDQSNIQGIDVFINRKFIDSGKTGTTARQLAKRLFDDFLPVTDRPAVESLLKEIEFGDPNRAEGSPPAPQLPDPPTLAYQAFLSIQEDYSQKCETAQLRLQNLPGDDGGKLLISIQRKANDEKK